MIVLDTHTWIWWIGDPGRLSEPATHRIENEVREGQVCVSSISCWELTLLVKKGRLELAVDPGEWIAKSESLPSMTLGAPLVTKDTKIRDYPSVESLW